MFTCTKNKRGHRPRFCAPAAFFARVDKYCEHTNTKQTTLKFLTQRMEIENEVTRPTISTNGLAITREFLRNGAIDDDITWRRDVGMNALASEMIDLHLCSLSIEARYDTWTSIPIGHEKSHKGRTVTHLGQGVFVQENTIGIDPDSRNHDPRTITTCEIRSFALRCLEASEKKALVIGTGQPRIGKTRGALAYTLQELLWRGEAVMRVGHKDNLAYLFLPQENGAYNVWQSHATKWNESFLPQDKNMYVLLDPPESADYHRAAACHVIEYCSNNDETHLKNAHKDASILIMKLPHLAEVLCMRSILMTNEKFPIDREEEDGNGGSKIVLKQSYTSLQGQEALEELYQRCILVGCVPGIVFNGFEFGGKLIEIESNTNSLCAQENMNHLISFYKGLNVRIGGTQKIPVSAMSRFFILDTVAIDRLWSSIRLNAVATFYIREILREKFALLTGDNAFEFEDVCAVLLQGGIWKGIPFPKRRIICGTHLNHTTELLLNHLDKDCTLLRASNCYPILDFATTRYNWFNAKVGSSTPKISLSAFVTLMIDLGFAIVDDNNFLVHNLGSTKISLVLIRNSSSNNWTFDKKLAIAYRDMNADQIISVFNDIVQVSVLNTADWSPQSSQVGQAQQTNLNRFNARMTMVESMLSEYSAFLPVV